MEHDIRVVTETIYSLLNDITYAFVGVGAGIIAFWLLATVGRAILELRNEKLNSRNRHHD